jgi:glyoxylase-like metal-dependent hydrolase (beta-lactamase superfamily II)
MSARAAGTTELSFGTMRMTFVPDGIIQMPPSTVYSGATPELFAANRHVLDDQGDLVMSLGSLLVETAGKRVLIDLAWGPSTLDIGALTNGQHQGRMSGGGLIENLAALGLSPSDIDVVLLSHLHVDHIGWLVTDTPAGPVPTFGRAEYFMTQQEWQYWRRPDGARTGGPTEAQLDFLASRFTPVEDGSVPVPGINVMHTPGHTPGHCSFVVSSGRERAVVLGDTLHCPLEIAHPELALLGDVDPAAAKATRERLRQQLVTPGTVTVGAHFPDVVFGRVLPAEVNRTFVGIG